MAAAPDIPKTHVAASSAASFEPYGRLLRMLMPSLRGVVVHDGYANFVWCSDEMDLADHPELVHDAIANALADDAEFAAVVHTLDADNVIYSIALRGGHSDLIGVVSLIARLGIAQEARPLNYVRQLVQPAVECLRRELALRSELGSRNHDLDGRDRDLSLMLEISSRRPASNSDADEFAMILRTGVEHIGCALSILWIPDKGIEESATRSGQPLSRESIDRAQRHLMAWMQLQQRTIIVNGAGKTGAAMSAPYKILACPVRHPSERVMGVLALFNPPSAADFEPHQARIAELLGKRATIIIQGRYDASTGLLTRQAFERQAGAMLAGSQGAEPHSILYLDIDRMHVINETFGMHVGDEVIKRVADCMARTLPREAIPARISGDRLAALLPRAGAESAAQVAEEIRAAVCAIAPPPGQGRFAVTVSLGTALIGNSDKALAHAVATAEIACKAAKDRGRNRVEVFQDSDQSIVRRHTDILMIGQIREALEQNRFTLHAQPILTLRNGSGRPRFELLLRMIGERGELLPPAKFLPAAERYQLMPAIDRWVVQHACTVLAAQGTGLAGASAHFAINLSGHSLQDREFPAYVIAQIERCRVPPDMLCFELTETATIGNLAQAQDFMATLQRLGCQFALDDFGTGVSSLAYLKDLPVNYLKIDGSFVRDALANPRSESLIKAIAQLAKVMGMQTIAEYVETDALRVRMADLGVDFGQGFAMGKSQPLEELLQELAVYEATVSDRGRLSA